MNEDPFKNHTDELHNEYSRLYKSAVKALHTADELADDYLKSFYLKAAEGFFIRSRKIGRRIGKVNLLRGDNRELAIKYNNHNQFNPEIMGFIAY